MNPGRLTQPRLTLNGRPFGPSPTLSCPERPGILESRRMVIRPGGVSATFLSVRHQTVGAANTGPQSSPIIKFRRNHDGALRGFCLGCWVVLGVLAASGSIATARAQGVDDGVEEEAGLGAQGPSVVFNVPRFKIADATFDQRIFGNLRESKRGYGRLETLANLRIAEVDRAVHLSEAQKQKLQLAARGDIKRFFDLVEEKRKVFVEVRNDQQKFAAFYPQLTPLREKFQKGLVGADSLLDKSLRKTLDEQQLIALDTLNHQRKQLSQKAILGRVVVSLDNALGLRAEQRQQLRKLIVEETRPPRTSSPYDVPVILYQVAALSHDRLKPIFHESQWPQVLQQLDTGRKYEAVLRARGLIPASGPLFDRWVLPLDSETPVEEAPRSGTRDESR